MKKKKSIIMSLAAAFLVGASAFAVGCDKKGQEGQSASQNTSEITSNTPVYTQPTLLGGEIEEEYYLGEYFTVPSAQIGFETQTLPAKAIIKKPNGELEQNEQIRLEQGGIYTLEYRAVFNGEVKSFQKDFTVQTPMFSMESKNSSAVYGLDASAYQTGKKGVNVVLAEGDVLQYNDIIDLNESNGDFLEFFLLPVDGAGTMDARKLTITLTDLHNPSISLTVVAQCSKPQNSVDKWYYDNTYMLAGGQNQTPTGFESGFNRLHVGNEWGAPTRFSFYGMHGSNVAVGSESLKLNYNAEENTVYANGVKVICLSDLDVFPEAWEGFTTGEVKLSISSDEHVVPYVNMMITRIGINNLNQTILADEQAPEITIDYDGYNEKDLPTAGKGYSYPVFGATAMDDMLGAVPVKTEVYYNYESNQRYQVEVSDGSFKTAKTGYYTIEYTAADGYNNVGVKTVTIECNEDSPAITAELNGEYVTSCKTGELLMPSAITHEGGTGRVITYATVKGQDGIELPMDEGFRAESVGSYTVTLYAKDMLGKTASCTYTVEVAANEAPIFLDEAVMPRYFLTDYNYTIPALNAYDYSSGKQEIATTIAVKDGAGERDLADGVGQFTPDEDGYATIIYKASGKLGNSQKEYKVRVVSPWIEEDTIDMSKYFYGENITATARKEGIKVSSSVDTEYTFINPVIAQNFEMQFAITGNEFTSLQLIFEDSQDKNVRFTIEIDKAADETANAFLKINGEETRYRPSAGFYDGKTFAFYYNDVKKELQDDVSLERVVKNADGSIFEGFPSQKFYVTAKMTGVYGNAELDWKNFGGQILSSNDMDTIKPMIAISGEYAVRYEYKSICEVYGATTADVLSPETYSGMTVYDPNGDVVTDVNGLKLENVPIANSYFIKLNVYGSYSVVYASEDAAGREQEYFYAIYVVDEIVPKIVLDGEMQTEVKLGKSIHIVKATAMDNVDGKVEVYAYVVDASGIIVKVENGGSYTPTVKGVYEIRYMAFDTYGNMKILTYKVTVH